MKEVTNEQWVKFQNSFNQLVKRGYLDVEPSVHGELDYKMTGKLKNEIEAMRTEILKRSDEAITEESLEALARWLCFVRLTEGDD